MIGNCSRCNKKVEETELMNHICKRCQDVLEFGYQSFPAYRLDEEVQALANIKYTGQTLVLK